MYVSGYTIKISAIPWQHIWGTSSRKEHQKNLSNLSKQSFVNKPRIVKDYEKLDEEIKERIKLTYPLGFTRQLVKFKNAQGQEVSALPFETEDKYYLVRMTVSQAVDIIAFDDDYDDAGILKDEIRVAYSDKYDDVDDDLVDDDDELETSVDPADLDDEVGDDDDY